MTEKCAALAAHFFAGLYILLVADLPGAEAHLFLTG
jgi:hypothetical protein